MADADSGVISVSRKKRRKKKTTRRRKSPQSQPASLPLNPLTITEAQVQAEPEKPSGLLESVKSLFSASPSASPSPSPSVPVSENSSATPSTSSPAPSAEIESQLSRVPDVVGDEPGELETGDESEAFDAGGISALLEAVAFEEQDVKDTLAELFDWLAETFESEHWKLTDRQVRMLGRPSAQLLNSIWAKLKTRIPDILSRWCETTPGATAFLMAFGLVVVPKGLKQWQISKQRARVALPNAGAEPKPVAARPVAPSSPVRRPDPTPRAAAVATSGAFGIPEASGIIGGK